MSPVGGLQAINQRSQRSSKTQRPFLGPLNIATLNVRTLLQVGQQALLATTLYERSIDICAISESRLPNSGSLTLNVPHAKNSYKLYYSGPDDRSGLHGVGIAVSSHLVPSVSEFIPINRRLAIMKIATKPLPLLLVATYAPTNDAKTEDADEFYEKLDSLVRLNKSSRELLIVAGDFNAQLGARTNRPETGMNTVGRLCSNGERLLNLAAINRLVAVNTLFHHKKRHLVTWASPDGRTLNQIDYIFVKQRWKSSFQDSRSYWGIHVQTDHALVSAKFKLRFSASKRVFIPNKKLDLEQLKDPNVLHKYQQKCNDLISENRIQDADSVEVSWSKLSSILQKASVQELGIVKRQSKAWITEKTILLAKERQIAWTNKQNKRAIQLAKDLKKNVRQDKRNYHNKLALELEAAAATSDIRTIYRLTKQLSGKYRVPVSEQVKDEHGKSVDNEEDKISLWKEYFNQLLNRPTPSVQLVLDRPPRNPYQIETGPPSFDEIVTAVKQLKNRKAPGGDNIPAELYKANTQEMTIEFGKIYKKIWQNEAIPTEWENAILIPVFKKGDRTSCKNYRGISLISVAYKVLEKIILKRLMPVKNPTTRESQAGFRPGRGCVDQIFTLHQILELRHEYRQPTFVAFLDFSAAFDSVDRPSIMKLLENDGVPSKLCRIIEAMYLRTTSQVSVYNKHTEPFQIRSGVRQGGILSPFLFNYCIDYVLGAALDNDQSFGIQMIPRQERITDLTFADDIALLSTSPQTLQAMIENIEMEAKKVGLLLSSLKSKYIATEEPIVPIELKINGSLIEKVDWFTYLGRCTEITGTSAKEIDARIQKSRASFISMSKFWKRKDVKLKFKRRIFNTTVRSILLYGCETWTTRVSDLSRLEVFQRRCLRYIACLP